MKVICERDGVVDTDNNATSVARSRLVSVDQAPDLRSTFGISDILAALAMVRVRLGRRW